MGPPGVLLYRCRLCGNLDTSRRVPDVTEALATLVRDAGRPVARSRDRHRLTETHTCTDGRVGVADLLGGVVDPALEELDLTDPDPAR